MVGKAKSPSTKPRLARSSCDSVPGRILLGYLLSCKTRMVSLAIELRKTATDSIFGIFLERYIVKGLTAGSLK